MRKNKRVPMKHALRQMLDLRLWAHLQLSSEEQAEVNRERLLPVLELHDLLNHYYVHGHCADERNSNGNTINDDGDHWYLVPPIVGDRDAV